MSNIKNKSLEIISLGMSDEKLLRELSTISRFKLEQRCRILGIDSVSELSDFSFIPRRTLSRYNKENTELLLYLLVGAAKKKHGSVITSGYLDFLKSKEFLHVKDGTMINICKAAGFSTMGAMCESFGFCERNMRRIAKNKPDYFVFLVAAIKNFIIPEDTGIEVSNSTHNGSIDSTINGVILTDDMDVEDPLFISRLYEFDQHEEDGTNCPTDLWPELYS